MTEHKSIVFELPDADVGHGGQEALVTVWGDDNPPTIALRPASGGTWGPPIDASHVEDPWPPSQDASGLVLKAIDHVAVASLIEGNGFAEAANDIAHRYRGNFNDPVQALVNALLAVAAELRAGRAT